MKKGAGRRRRIEDAYFDWLTHLVQDGGNTCNVCWSRLFRLLHETEFHYILDLDRNRASDGVRLRYHFGAEHGYTEEEVEDRLDTVPCSVLEMMIALARRCEDRMTDEAYGDRTGEWFFAMLDSLGLANMDDNNFDPGVARDILTRFLYREYEPGGEGGLFTLRFRHDDLRQVEIWYQAMWWLSEYIYGERV